MFAKELEKGIEFTSSGQLLNFSAANGFPPLAYTSFLTPFFDEFKVCASNHRPLWPSKPKPESVQSWQVFAQDIEDFLNNYDDDAISIGHSMGASTLVLAAAAKPSRIKRLVLVEPGLVPPSYYLFLQMFRPLVKAHVPLIKRTLTRVDSWPNSEMAFDHFRPKSVFRRLTDEALMDYVRFGTQSDGEGRLNLLYSKEWEARCYLLAHNIWSQLINLTIPVLVVRGANSNTFSESTYKRLQRLAPHFEYLEIPDSGHLVPLERPRELAQEILARI